MSASEAVGRPADGRLRAVALLALALLAPPQSATAADGEGPGRIALVLTYKCRPEDRPAFREHLAGPALSQLSTWQRDGYLADHLLLFNVDVNEDAWDAFLVLRFRGWPQYAKWKETERSHPAALTGVGLRFTTSISSALSELAWEGEAPAGRVSGVPAVYFVRPYYYKDKNLYRQFFEAYNAPQLAAWAREGAVRSYRVLMNQNPTGDTWGVLFIYEYPGWEAANARDDVKDAIGPELRKIPGWELLGETKGGIRTSGRVTLAERLGPPPAAR